MITDEIIGNAPAIILRERDSLGKFRIVRKGDLIVLNTDLEGLVTGFKTPDGTEYTYLDRRDLTSNDYAQGQHNIPGGFYSKDIFLNYHLESHENDPDVWISNILASQYTNFTELTSLELIMLIRLKVTYNQNEYFSYEVFEIVNDGELQLTADEYGRIDTSEWTQKPDIDIPQDLFDLDETFYNKNIFYASESGISPEEKFLRAYSIIKIGICIQRCENHIFPLLSPNDTVVQLVVQKQREFWASSNGIFSGSSTKEIVKYSSGMADLISSAEADQLKIDGETGLDSLWRFAAVLSPLAFSVIEIDLRIKILLTIAKLKKLDEKIGWEPIDFESIVTSIVLSVDSEDADLFLNALVNNWASEDVTLFQYLFAGCFWPLIIYRWPTWVNINFIRKIDTILLF